MKHFLFISLIIIIFSSCRIHTTENYYTVTITEDAAIYLKSDLNSRLEEIVTAGEPIYMILDKSRKGFRKIKYKGKVGYVYRPSYKTYSSNEYKQITSTTDSINKAKVKTFNPSTTSGGTVHVKGYYRKNGTYVKPHTRSAPRRR
ncbi:hypothetical protein [Sphingobacterium daejeonense]|uniref:hypothetical protein n=1 Tax=Sphingobacterium daejeonense TaxID=371142 RepID=UPI0010C47730|nr:hypothetical protein [Sphingobacterium daejeonense]VTP96419.1 Uncharacterised protein [Sphingobacterium daejeonense]